jgi:hypothetical protein
MFIMLLHGLGMYNKKIYREYFDSLPEQVKQEVLYIMNQRQQLKNIEKYKSEFINAPKFINHIYANS